MDWPTCNAVEFARLCDVTGQSVTNWMDEGMPCKRGAGRGNPVVIDPAQAIPWVLARRAPPGSERERLAKAQADKVELDNAKRRGELVEESFVRSLLMGMAAQLNGMLDGLPGRCASAVVGLTAAEARARLLDETRSIRAGMAEHVQQLSDAAHGASADGEDAPAATPPKRKRVGGRKPNPAARKRRAGTVEE
jgi:phage terminase Nu1 subunit (DNA packaging protein)